MMIAPEGAGDPAVQRVVIGIDFGAASLAAARWTAHHLAPHAELVLAHVIPLPKFSGDARDDIVRELTLAMCGALSALADSLGAVRCVVDVRVGEADEQLAAIASEHEAELVVLGRLGQRTRGGKQLGSTAERLLRRATTPVLLAAGALRTRPRRLLAAVDDGEPTPAVLSWARRLARRTDERATASLAVLHVVSDTTFAHGGVLVHDVDPRASASAWLRTRLSAAAIDPDSVACAVGIGDPRHEILAAADAFESDLLIVGRRGASGADVGVGSVARAALRPTTRSVLVVPWLSRVPRLDARRQLLRVVSRQRPRFAADPDHDPPAA
jgi:nucleotide-binding universal stress UspA family protein